MKKRSRIGCLLLIGIFCFTSVVPVMADEISDTRDEKKELEAKQEAAEKTKKELNEKLNTLTKEIKSAQEQLEAKQIEIIEAQDELDAAKINEREQYTAMKLRIKFMYENGNTEMIEMLCESKNISDFLNKADYIQQISDYDRKMLTEFQDTVKEIEAKEAKLKEEEAELSKLQDKLIAQKGEMDGLIAKASTDIEDIKADLKVVTTKLNNLIAQANANKNPTGGGTAGPSQIIGNGTLAWPTTSQRITSYYGWRIAPVAGATSWHDAIDIGAPTGTPVYAVADGTVITAKWGYNGGRGVYIMVDHGNGLVTRYQHLSDMYVSVGQTVTKGQNIAAVGNTGASSGPHLDYAIYVNGQTVDPLLYY